MSHRHFVECNENSLNSPRLEAAPAAEALTANLEAVRNAYIVDRGCVV